MPRSVHNLAANTDKRNFEDLLKKTAEAIFMAKCLKFNGFFGDPRNPPPEMNRAIVFISSLLLRSLSSSQTLFNHPEKNWIAPKYLDAIQFFKYKLVLFINGQNFQNPLSMQASSDCRHQRSRDGGVHLEEQRHH